MRLFDYSHISDDLRDNDVCNLVSANLRQLRMHTDYKYGCKRKT